MYLCYDSHTGCYTDHFDWQGEGVAYRGRALVEIQTTLGELPEVPVEDINNDDILRVQVSPPRISGNMKIPLTWELLVNCVVFFLKTNLLHGWVHYPEFSSQKFMRRRKYKLHAAFLNATMVSAIDAPVEFEVSIGKQHHSSWLLSSSFFL